MIFLGHILFYAYQLPSLSLSVKTLIKFLFTLSPLSGSTYISYDLRKLKRVQ